MQFININIDKIDRIYHIADVHVRNVKRHKEYEQVFKRLYKYIKNTKTPNSVIYVAGDIVHAKTDMSPELVQTVSDFFDDKKGEMEETGKNEYILTSDEVENFSPNEVKKTFNIYDDEDNSLN